MSIVGALGDGTVDGFEWKATQSAPFNKDKEVEPVFGLAVGCAHSFPAKARTVKPHRKLELWKGRSVNDLVAACADEPTVYVSDDQTR